MFRNIMVTERHLLRLKDFFWGGGMAKIVSYVSTMQQSYIQRKTSKFKGLTLEPNTFIAQNNLMNFTTRKHFNGNISIQCIAVHYYKL